MTTTDNQHTATPGVSDRSRRALVAAIKPVAEKPQKPKGIGPTPEQMHKATFIRGGAKVENGQVSAIAYRREPLFESMAKDRRVGLTAEDLRALRFYREAFETTARSLTRCALDVDGRGGGGVPLCLPSGADATRTLRLCEQAMGAVTATMRSVALDDKSFSVVAIERYGSRRQSWIEMEKEPGRKGKGGRKMAYHEKIVPISGRHRALVRDDFLVALERLRGVVTLLTSTAVVRRPGADHAVMRAPIEVTPDDVDFTVALDPLFYDDAGNLKSWAEVAEVIRMRMAEGEAE